MSVTHSSVQRWIIVLLLPLTLAACGTDDAPAPTPPTTPDAAFAASPTTLPAATPTSTSRTNVPASPTTAPATSTTAAVPPSPTPPSAASSSPTPWVDLAPLDDPNLGMTVYWLGERFEPGGELPPLRLAYAHGGGSGEPGVSARLEYAPLDPGSAAVPVQLWLWQRATWDALVATAPTGDDFATVFHLFWDSPCAQREDVALANGGQAVIYSGYTAQAHAAGSPCPSSPPDRFLAHAFFDDVVVAVNPPISLGGADMPSSGPYGSVDALRAVVQGLVPRAPVVNPTPLATPAANLDDPNTLTLQAADLPGRYGYGDDGCAPERPCPTDPQSFGSEGVPTEALPNAFGLFRAAYYQYEHTGFSAAGTPDPLVEPPVIDSYAYVCVSDCDPATILTLAPELLDYLGDLNPHEVTADVALGDEARLFEVEPLVIGQIGSGYAVVWRDGLVVGVVIVGGVAGDEGLALTLELAGKQEARIAAAVE